MRLFLLFLSALFLVSCVSAPTQPNQAISAESAQAHIEKIAAIQQFSLRGKIGVQADGKGFSGQIAWQHQTDRDVLTLYSPLGSQVALIEKSGGKVTLTDSKGNTLTEDNLQTLTEKTLGWALPLDGLTDWALGRPSTQPIQLQSRDPNGRLTKLKQEDWDIDYQAYLNHQNTVLPQRMHLRRVEANVKLVIESWAEINP